MGRADRCAADRGRRAVIREAPINSSYLIMVPGENKPREYPMGRIRLFQKKGDAAAFAAAYAQNLSSWAVVMKDDPPPLPIREAPPRRRRWSTSCSPSSC